MSKLLTDAMIDGGLDKVATCIRFSICAGQPTSYADIAARTLATKSITSGAFTKANGDTSGRKVTIAAQTDVDITVSGTADHVVIDDGTNYVVTTCAPQALTSGGTVSTNAYALEVSDPA